MKFRKHKKYFQILGLALVMVNVPLKLYASVTSLESKVVTKKQSVLNIVNDIAGKLDLDPEIVLATYIELGGATLDNEFAFRVEGNSCAEDVLLSECVRISNKALNLPKDHNIQESDIDTLKFIMYNTTGLEKESIAYYGGTKVTKSTLLQLKQRYIEFARTLYVNWQNELTMGNKAYTLQPTASVVVSDSVNKTTKFNWLVDRSRLDGQPLRITSQYAYRDGGQMHRALDFATKEFVGENGNAGELNLYPVYEGTVITVQTNPKTSTGLAVWYEFKDALGDKYNVSYMHMSSLGNIGVGSKVGVGTVLGTTGSTGDATGIHIHIQVDKNGQRINPLRLWGYDPLASEKDREKWVDDNNLVIPCMGECLVDLNYNNADKEFSIVKCLTHRLS